MSDPGEYYARKERERKAAWDAREAIRDMIQEVSERISRDKERLQSLEADLRKADRAYDLAAYVGD